MPTLITERSTYWMISGGSSPSSNYDYRPYWRIYYDTDAANNRTLITVNYYVQCRYSGSGAIWVDSSSITAKINSSSIGSISGSFGFDSTTLLSRGTKTTYINHNADGSASFTFQGTGTMLSTTKSTSTSTYSTANGDFPAIPQGTTVTQTISTKSESSIKVNWTAADSVDYIWYSTNNGSSYTAVGSVSGTSGNYTISGLSPNTTYTIVTRARRQSSQIDTNYSNATSVPTYTAPTITSISDVTETSFKINWSSSYTYSTAQYSVNNGSSWSNMPIGNVITGLTADTNYQVKVRAQVSGLPMYEAGSAVKEQKTYDYPKPTSMNNFEIGDGASVNLYNPLGRSVTLQILQVSTDTLLGTYTGSSSGIINAEFKTNDAISRQYASITNSKTGKYYCKVTYGSIVKTLTDTNNNTYSVKESINKPDLLANYFSCYDVNSTTTSLTGDASIIVNGYSTLRIDADTNPVGKNGATIQYININGTPYTWSNDFTTQIGSWTNPIVEIYVTDSRGIQSDKVYINLSWKDYTNLVKGNFSSSRSNQGVGDAVTFNFDGTFWNDTFGSTQNSLSATYTIYNQKTQTTTTGTSTITITTSNNTYSFNDVLYGDTNNGFDVDTKYTVTITVSDSLSNTTFTYTIIEGTPAIALYGNNVALGQKYDTNVGGRVQLLGYNIDNIWKERRITEWSIYRGTNGNAWYHICQINVTDGINVLDLYSSSTATNVGFRGDWHLRLTLGTDNNTTHIQLIYGINNINTSQIRIFRSSNNKTYDIYFYMPQWTQYNFAIYSMFQIWTSYISITTDNTQTTPSGYNELSIYGGQLGYAKLYSNSTLSSGTGKIAFDQLETNNDTKFSYYSNTIKIGKGVRKIEVSGQLWIYPRSTTRQWVAVTKNGNTTISTAIGYNSSYGMLHISPTSIDVGEGDTIQFDISNLQGGNDLAVNDGSGNPAIASYLFVKEIGI